jgi:excisionase family DNA binding protein
MEPGISNEIGAVEAAKRLGISRRTLYRYTIDGLIPSTRRLPSGFFRYSLDAIEEAAKKQIENSENLTKVEP